MNDAPPAPLLYPLFNVRGDPAVLRPLIRFITSVTNERQFDLLRRVLTAEAERLNAEQVA